MRKSKNCRMTKGGNTCPTSSSNSLIAAEFIDATRLATGHSRNRVAECANRTMGDDISAMLYEAQLPPLLWGEALATQIHVWNCLPMSSLKGMTPYEAWFKQKPDVSHLRVWGCLAYVFIQKDKRRSLQPHMEKCVFMGYPSGYKGWKFYNPTTQKYLISERAEFDERIFPGLQNTRQHRPLISCHLVHCLWPLCRLLCPCWIWRGIVILRSLHLTFLMLSCHSTQRCLNALLHHQHRQPLSTHLSLLLRTICHQIFAAHHAFRVRQVNGGR